MLSATFGGALVGAFLGAVVTLYVKKEEDKGSILLKKEKLLSLPFQVHAKHVDVVLDLILKYQTRILGCQYSEGFAPRPYISNERDKDGGVHFCYADTIFALSSKTDKKDNAWEKVTHQIELRPYQFDDVETSFSEVLYELARFEQLAQKIPGFKPEDIPIRVLRLVHVMAATGEEGEKMREDDPYIVAAVHAFIAERKAVSPLVFALFKRVSPEWKPVPWTEEFAKQAFDEYYERIGEPKD